MIKEPFKSNGIRSLVRTRSENGIIETVESTVLNDNGNALFDGSTNILIVYKENEQENCQTKAN